jgi:hypothetical protein
VKLDQGVRMSLRQKVKAECFNPVISLSSISRRNPMTNDFLTMFLLD